MANVCGTSLHACASRVTRLASDGNVATPPNNTWVSESLISVQLTPRVAAGADIELRGGCDCIIAAYLGPDLLKGFDIEVVDGKLQPGLDDILTGAAAITEAGDVIGAWAPGLLDCGGTQPRAAYEFWTDVYVGTAISAARPYIHHLFPGAVWQKGQQSFANEFGTNPYTGKATSNEVWGNGPYGDQPEAAPTDTAYGWWYSNDAKPSATCDYTDTTPAS